MGTNYHNYQFKNFIDRIAINVIYVLTEDVEDIKEEYYTMMSTPTKITGTFVDPATGVDIDVFSGGELIWKITFNGCYLNDFGNKYDTLEQASLGELNFENSINSQVIHQSEEIISKEWLKTRLNKIKYDQSTNSFSDSNSFFGEKFEKYYFRSIINQEIFQFYLLFHEKLKGTISRFPKKDGIFKSNKLKDNKVKRTFHKQSFELNPDLIREETPEERLKNFNKALESNNLIEHIDYRLFELVFTNKKVNQTIKWISKPNELYYLIKNLHDNNIIKPFQNYWQVVCKCFELHDGSGKSLTSSYLAHCHQPKRGNRLLILNSVISTLN